jgi:hypothetical protein
MSAFSEVMHRIKLEINRSCYQATLSTNHSSNYSSFLYQPIETIPEAIKDLIPDLVSSIEQISLTEFDIIGMDFLYVISAYISRQKLEEPGFFEQALFRLSWDILDQRTDLSISTEFLDYASSFIDTLISDSNTAPSLAGDLRRMQKVLVSKSQLSLFA